MNQLQGVLLSILLSTLSCYGFEVTKNIQVPDSQIHQISQSTAWLKLMHYRPNMWGHLRSEVDGPGFFFSPHGFTQPEEELKASLQALYSSQLVGKIKMPVRCAFPERTLFLTEAFHLPPQNVSCEKLNTFMEQFHAPQSVSIVFSSAYPNNSASMFGHTFLKINSSRSSDLLDMGINYAAVVADDENGFAFVWFGTTGGYVGQWSVQPYYVKVGEYSNSESRDLWEYKLSLTPEETKRLIHHIWELEINSYMDYYFFDENCSYQILAAIEAIRPDWNLLRQKIYLIPGESIKYVTTQPGAVQQVTFRPSLYNRINSRYKLLTLDQKKIFQKVVNQEIPPESLSDRIVADALLTYYEYKKNDQPKAWTTKQTQQLENLRSRRAHLGILTEAEKEKVPTLEGQTRPDWGHDSYSLWTGGGYYANRKSDLDSPFLSLKIKSAYHDLLDNDLGYTRYAHIDFPYAELRYYSIKSKWSIQEIGGIGTTSLTPVSYLKTPIAFRGLVNYRRFDLKDKSDLHAVHAEAGGGLSFDFINNHNRFYFLGLGATDLSSDLKKGYSLLPGIEIGLLLNPFEHYKLQVLQRTFCDLNYSNKCYAQAEYQLNQSFFISRNQEVRQINELKDSAEKRGTTTLQSSLNYIRFFN